MGKLERLHSFKTQIKRQYLKAKLPCINQYPQSLLYPQEHAVFYFLPCAFIGDDVSNPYNRTK